MKFIKIISLGLVLVLGACGGNKVITTTDDSADYQSAKQLPPLNKTTSVGSTANNGQELNAPQPVTTAAPQADTNQLIVTSLVDGSNDTKRVKIDAEINAAWPYFLTKLRTSGVTIHSRNNAAYQVEVGCGSMSDDTGENNIGGWSLFNRDNRVYEYCAMALSSNKDSTLVSVLDRQRQEVRGSEAMKLLNQVVSH